MSQTNATTTEARVADLNRRITNCQRCLATAGHMHNNAKTRQRVKELVIERNALLAGK